MATTHIPKHNISDKFKGEMIALWHIDNKEPKKESVDYAHRDDYYMFIFMNSGSAKMAIDFNEHEATAPAVVFILPEQVHLVTEHQNLNSWVLIVDKMLVNTQYKDIFQSASIKDGSTISTNQANDLNDCIAILDRRLNQCYQPSNDELIRALLATFIGVFAEIYHTKDIKRDSKRSHTITAQFRTILSAQYKTMKSPSEYANAINISPIYLNEVIKKSTGITVSQHIHNEVILQAKRLLFYTTMSVKEIAIELGYEDWAYFTRLFTKNTSLSPTQFREKYLK